MKNVVYVLVAAIVMSLGLSSTATAEPAIESPLVGIEQIEDDPMPIIDPSELEESVDGVPHQGELLAICDSYCVGSKRDMSPLDLIGAFGACAQMPHQFVTQVAAATGLQAKSVACAGATVDEARNGKYGQPPQIDALSKEKTKIVVVRIGGNDVGLTPSGACFAAFFDCVRDDWLIQRAYTGVGTLPVKLDSLYADIKARIAPDTKVLAVGYPPVVSRQVDRDQEVLCRLFISPQERQTIGDLQDALNDEVKEAADRAGFVYVDPFAATSPFMGYDAQGKGYGACSTSPDKAISLVELTNSPLHPTYAGVDMDARLITPYALAS